MVIAASPPAEAVIPKRIRACRHLIPTRSRTVSVTTAAATWRLRGGGERPLGFDYRSTETVEWGWANLQSIWDRRQMWRTKSLQTSTVRSVRRRLPPSRSSPLWWLRGLGLQDGDRCRFRREGGGEVEEEDGLAFVEAIGRRKRGVGRREREVGDDK